MSDDVNNSSCAACAGQSCVCSRGCCAKAKKASGCVVKFLAVAVLIGWYCWASNAFNTSEDAKKRKIAITVEVEKEAKSDYVIWRLGFQNAGADIKVLQEKFSKDRDLIVSFLKSKGFKDEDISIAGPRMIDQFAKESSRGSKVLENSRYIIGSRVKVISTNVDMVTQAVKEVDALVKDGVILVHSDREANPRYYLKNQTQLEQDLQEEICLKAKVIAERMAKTMGVNLGKVHSAEGPRPVEILGQGQSGPANYWNGFNERLRGPVKIAHLQQRFEFEIY